MGYVVALTLLLPPAVVWPLMLRTVGLAPGYYPVLVGIEGMWLTLLLQHRP